MISLPFSFICGLLNQQTQFPYLSFEDMVVGLTKCYSPGLTGKKKGELQAHPRALIPIQRRHLYSYPTSLLAHPIIYPDICYIEFPIILHSSEEGPNRCITYYAPVCEGCFIYLDFLSQTQNRALLRFG